MYGGPYEMLSDIEENQCVTCIHRKNPDEDGQHAEDYPMCYEVEGIIVEHEAVVEPLVKRTDGVVVCTRHKPGDPHMEPDENQMRLPLGEK